MVNMMTLISIILNYRIILKYQQLYRLMKLDIQRIEDQKLKYEENMKNLYY